MPGQRRARLAAGGSDEVEPVSLTVGAVVAALVLKGAEKTGEKVTEGGLAASARVEDLPGGPTQLAALPAAAAP
jgi:hypothetical protein